MSNTNWHDTAMRSSPFDDLDWLFALPSPAAEPFPAGLREPLPADLADLDALFDGSVTTTPRGLVRQPVPRWVQFAVIARDGLVCRHCSCVVRIGVGYAKHDDVLQFDHVVPVSKGGENSVENLVVSCGRCNRLRRAAGLPIGALP